MAAEMTSDAAGSQGPAVCVLDYSNDPRTLALLALRSFWQGDHHDHTPASWDGSPRNGKDSYLIERLDVGAYQSTNLNADAWGYSARRPNASASMPRCVTSAFTAALLGRPPQLATPSDPRTSRYLTTCWDVCDGWAVLTEARNFAGVQGAAALVPSLIGGELALDAYWAHEMHVLEWCDAAGWRPKRAIHQTEICVEADPDEDGEVRSVPMIRTREWNETHVTVYEDVEPDHEGPIPIVSTVEHKMGRCPVVWLQNTRTSREPEGGYDMQTPQVLEMSDQLDRVQSFGVRATKANASPTLYRRDHMHWLQRGGPVRKGHGAEITGTPDGDVKFLESDGMGVTNSWSTAQKLRVQIMQATNCILPDMDWAVSNIAVETFLMLFRSMDARCDLLQTPLRRCIREICDIFITLGTAFPVLDSEKASADAEGLRLPPDVTIDEPAGDELEDLEEDAKISTAPYEVGKARHVDVIWPPRQLLSPSQLVAFVGALNAAVTAGLMATDTAIEALASARGLMDVAGEKRRILLEKAKGKAQMMANGLPPGGLPGDDVVADEETDGAGDADGDGVIHEGTAEQQSKQPGA